MLIAINEQDPRPIYLQIAAEIKAQIRAGILQPGDELPAVRELAGALGINLHTVHRAYQQLRDQRIITLRLGQRAKIAPLRQQPARREDIEDAIGSKLNDLVTEAFHLGLTPDDFRALVEEKINEKR